MVSVVATNAKLRERTVHILREAADLDDADARTCSSAAAAISRPHRRLHRGAPPGSVDLETHDGSVRAAIAELVGADA